MKPIVTMRAALSDPDLLGSVLAGDSWLPWRALLLAALGERLTDEEREAFTRLTGREREPLSRVDECSSGRSRPRRDKHADRRCRRRAPPPWRCRERWRCEPSSQAMLGDRVGSPTDRSFLTNQRSPMTAARMQQVVERFRNEHGRDFYSKNCGCK
jgi:hypothetical protein